MKLHRKMRGTARSGKWALGLRCTTSAYWIFKSFGGRFRTVLLTSLIFDCCGRLKTLGSNAGPLKSPTASLHLPARPFDSHAVVLRANIRSILAAMMKSFSCSPLIFLVCRETVALPQPKQTFG